MSADTSFILNSSILLASASLVVVTIGSSVYLSKRQEKSKQVDSRVRDINLKVNNLMRSLTEAKAIGFGTVPEIAIYARMILLLEESISLKSNKELEKELDLMRHKIAELSSNFQRTKIRQFKDPMQLSKVEKTITVVKQWIAQAFAKGFVVVNQFHEEMDNLEDSKVTIRAFLMISLTKKLYQAKAFNAEMQAMKTKEFIEMNDFLRKELFLTSINKILSKIEKEKLELEQERSKTTEIHDPLANFERTLKSKDHL
ncbi:hypothetical protein P5E37_04245 [Vibrio parahaemolyticus]|nr:hypothetical protein [Vibrio parahaemolyticus]